MRVTLQLDIDDIVSENPATSTAAAAAPVTRFRGTACTGDGTPPVDFAGAFELMTVLERLVQESADIRSRSSRRDESPSLP